MEKFNIDDIYRYKDRYEDVSEPLCEYMVTPYNELVETSGSCSLLGVKQNGKWGWIDKSEKFVIQPIYDFGFVLCIKGIIVLDKNGYQGGLYRETLKQAFSFQYRNLSYVWGDTFVAWNNNNRCALVKPGDYMLTSFKYKGFSKYNRGNVTEYVKGGLFGDSSGLIDLDTGREL